MAPRRTDLPARMAGAGWHGHTSALTPWDGQVAGLLAVSTLSLSSCMVLPHSCGQQHLQVSPDHGTIPLYRSDHFSTAGWILPWQHDLSCPGAGPALSTTVTFPSGHQGVSHLPKFLPRPWAKTFSCHSLCHSPSFISHTSSTEIIALPFPPSSTLPRQRLQLHLFKKTD